MSSFGSTDRRRGFESKSEPRRYGIVGVTQSAQCAITPLPKTGAAHGGLVCVSQLTRASNDTRSSLFLISGRASSGLHDHQLPRTHEESHTPAQDGDRNSNPLISNIIICGFTSQYQGSTASRRQPCDLSIRPAPENRACYDSLSHLAWSVGTYPLPGIHATCNRGYER